MGIFSWDENHHIAEAILKAEAFDILINKFNFVATEWHNPFTKTIDYGLVRKEDYYADIEIPITKEQYETLIKAGIKNGTRNG